MLEKAYREADEGKFVAVRGDAGKVRGKWGDRGCQLGQRRHNDSEGGRKIQCWAGKGFEYRK